MTSSLVVELIAGFQTVVGQVPELVRPLVVAAAATVPFVEGELAAAVGVVGGVHPVVAGVAAAAGNFACVVLVVLLGVRARAAIVGQAKADVVKKPSSKGRARFQRWLVRFGVPGASLLGPLAVPTQITAATLVAAGVPMRRVLLWQGVAIVLWTALATSSTTAAVAFAT